MDDLYTQCKSSNPTRSPDFGVSKREAHDSSDFYNSSLYLDSDHLPEIPLEDQAEMSVPKPGNKADRLYFQSSEQMAQIPDNCIGLAVTSLPNNAGKQYDDNLSLGEYLTLIRTVGTEVYRPLRPGGCYAVNIATLGRNP